MPSSAGSEEHTSELQSPCNLVCRLLLEKKRNHLSYGAPGTLGRAGLAGVEGRGPGQAGRPVLPGVTDGGRGRCRRYPVLFFLNDPATPETYPLSLRVPFPL